MTKLLARLLELLAGAMGIPGKADTERNRLLPIPDYETEDRELELFETFPSAYTGMRCIRLAA